MRIPAILSDSLIGAADSDDLFGNLQSGSSQSTQVDNSSSIILPILIVTVCLIALLVNYIIAKHMEDVAICYVLLAWTDWIYLRCYASKQNTQNASRGSFAFS